MGIPDRYLLLAQTLGKIVRHVPRAMPVDLPVSLSSADREDEGKDQLSVENIDAVRDRDLAEERHSRCCCVVDSSLMPDRAEQFSDCVSAIRTAPSNTSQKLGNIHRGAERVRARRPVNLIQILQHGRSLVHDRPRARVDRLRPGRQDRGRSRAVGHSASALTFSTTSGHTRRDHAQLDVDDVAPSISAGPNRSSKLRRVGDHLTPSWPRRQCGGAPSAVRSPASLATRRGSPPRWPQRAGRRC